MDDLPRRNPLLPAVIFGIFQGVIWLSAGVWFMRISISMEKIFADFRVDLLELTKGFIAFDHLLLDYWWLAIPFVLLWALANVAIVGALGLARSGLADLRRWTWYVLATLAPLAFVALAALAYTSSVQALINDLANHK